MSFALSAGRPSLGGRSLAKAVAPKEVYSFPILEPEEIVDVLREMGAAVTEEDINKPKAETFRALCELFVFEVLGMNKDQLYEAHFEFVEALDGTEELHEGSVPIIHFVRNMNKVLASARCDEGLSLRDLMKPERARVLRVLSALINMQKFKIEKAVWYAEQGEAKAAALRRKDGIAAQHADVRRRAEAEKSLRDAEAPAIAAAHAERRELEATRNALSAQLEALRAGTKGTKEELLIARDAALAAAQRVAELRAQADAVRGQIVSSPAKVRAEVAALEAAVAAEQRTLDALDARRRGAEKRVAVVAKADKDVVKAVTLMGEAEAEAVKLKRVQKEEKQRKCEVEAVCAEVEALRAQLEQAQAAKRRAEEKAAEARAAGEARLAAQARELEATQREAADYNDDLKASVDARRAAEGEKMRLERRKESLIAHHSSEVAEMVNSLKRLQGSLVTYDTGVLAGLAVVEGMPLRAGL